MYKDIEKCADHDKHRLSEPFRQAMRKVPAAVHIITSAGMEGKCGMTATAVLSVSDNPPTLLVSVNSKSVSGQQLIKNGFFGVNTLAACDQHLADLFAGRTACAREQRFISGEWLTMSTGSPILTTARVAFDCRLVSVTTVATHQLLIGEVIAMGSSMPSSDGCLIYLGRDFKAV